MYNVYGSWNFIKRSFCCISNWLLNLRHNNILDKMMNDEKNIIAQIETYIRQGSGEYSEWYVGIADNPLDPITEAFRFNKVRNHRFTYIETISHDIAKAVADYFINVCGTDGNISEIKTGEALFVYKKAEHVTGQPVQSIANQSSNLSSQDSLSAQL